MVLLVGIHTLIVDEIYLQNNNRIPTFTSASINKLMSSMILSFYQFLHISHILSLFHTASYGIHEHVINKHNKSIYSNDLYR